MIRHPNKGYVSENDGRVVHPRPLFPGAKLRQFLKILRIASKRCYACPDLFSRRLCVGVRHVSSDPTLSQGEGAGSYN